MISARASRVAGIGMIALGSLATLYSISRWRIVGGPISVGTMSGAEWAVYEVRRILPFAKGKGYIGRARCLDRPGGEWTDIWYEGNVAIFPTQGAAMQRALTVASGIGCQS